MVDWTEALKSSLLLRGVKLNPAACESSIAALKIASPIVLPEDLIKILMEFDGFAEGYPDPRSEILLWSTSNIISYLRATNRRKNYIPIADFFIGSELICLNENLSTFWEDRKINVAPDVRSFVEGLAAGEYNT